MPWTKISINKADQVRSVEARLVRLILSRRACARGCGKTWDDLSNDCWVYHRPGARLTWLCEPCAASPEDDDSAIPLCC